LSRAWLLRLGIIAIILILWEGVRRLGLVGPLLLASPSEIATALFQSYAQFFVAFQLTFAEIVLAIAISWIVGIAIGLVAGMVSFVGAAGGPILSSLFAIPLITWYPLFMVWFGIGPLSKIAYAVVSGILPIAIATMNGIRGLDRRYLLYGRAIGCSRRQLVFRVLVPLAIPSVVAGLRIGTALCVIGVVVAEMLASLGGIGYLITYYRAFYDTGQVYLGILLALLCALLANMLLSRIERRFLYWRELQMVEQ
jgi:NitT/TauT family transport system permease protein